MSRLQYKRSIVMDAKVLLVYSEGTEYKIESVWATKIGEYYRIENIPFFAKSIAPGDVISVEEDNGELYFEQLIRASGNSVVRIVLFNENDLNTVTKYLEDKGCNWEGSHIANLIAVEIPKNIVYEQIKSYLVAGRNSGIFDFQEACLGFK